MSVRATPIALVTAFAAIAVLGLTTTWAHAAFTAQPSAAHSVSTLVVGSAGSPSAATADACATVDVSWQRATNAGTYDVERQIDTAAWQLVATDLGDVAGWRDAAPGAAPGSQVRYRVVARHVVSGWTAPPATTPYLNC